MLEWSDTFIFFRAAAWVGILFICLALVVWVAAQGSDTPVSFDPRRV